MAAPPRMKIGHMTGPPFTMCSASVSSVAAILCALPLVGSTGMAPAPEATKSPAVFTSSGFSKPVSAGSSEPSRCPAVPTMEPSLARKSAIGPASTKVPSRTSPEASTAVPSKRAPPKESCSRSSDRATSDACTAKTSPRGRPSFSTASLASSSGARRRWSSAMCRPDSKLRMYSPRRFER